MSAAMSNEARVLAKQFQSKEGMTAGDAICAVVDHFNLLHWQDRNRYGEEIKALKAQNDDLADRLSTLESTLNLT